MFKIRKFFVRKLRDLFPGRGEISIFHEFHRPPYGGGNQFLLALVEEFGRLGKSVDLNRVHRGTRVCLFNSYNFDADYLRVLRARYPKTLFVHRIDGPVSKYRDAYSDEDRVVHELNRELADRSILQSEYSLEANRELGFVFKKPVVIPNACDSRFFHRPAAQRRLDVRKFRIVGSSWSNNRNKGRDLYEWLDRNLDFDRFEFTFVGRVEAEFKHIRKLDPVNSERLADLLREHDAYLAPSRNDPCSNALIEALSCGLPAVYLNSGGHPELVGPGGIPFNTAEEVPPALERLVADYGRYRDAIQTSSIETVAGRYLRVFDL